VRNFISLTVREECRLRVFENRVLRRIFGSKRDEMAHNEELHNLYASPNIIRVIKPGKRRWTGPVASMREIKNSYKILVGNL
jgi:hypothetical protein